MCVRVNMPYIGFASTWRQDWRSSQEGAEKIVVGYPPTSIFLKAGRKMEELILREIYSVLPQHLKHNTANKTLHYKTTSPQTKSGLHIVLYSFMCVCVHVGRVFCSGKESRMWVLNAFVCDFL